jgi:hypothetical protein
MSMASHGIHGQGMTPRASPLNGGPAGDFLEYDHKPGWGRSPLDGKFQAL